jgi:hypothetical protein
MARRKGPSKRQTSPLTPRPRRAQGGGRLLIKGNDAEPYWRPPHRGYVERRAAPAYLLTPHTENGLQTLLTQQDN